MEKVSNDQSGFSVSISTDGNTLAIGANLNDGTGPNAGHVRVYEWSGTVWIQKGVDIDGEATNDISGYSVSISSDGNTVAISAPYNDGTGPLSAGHVRIYHFCSSISSVDTQSACDSYTWIDSNTYTSNNNTATHTLSNANGCDSVVTLDLTINSVNSSVTQNGITLSADLAGAAYQWLDCDNSFSIITGETNQSFTATANGNYALQITENGCVDTSACVTINTMEINENNLKDVEVYPNPTSDIITIKGLNSLSDVSYIHLLDNKGALVKKVSINESQIDLSSFSTGIYFIEIKHRDGTGRIKVIKQ